ncbi:DUF262 domain-containing protein [Pseudarthrobacter niigatensis]|uniref:GmrSD restriction endonucleases N-terminal domain-containing protein n=1 Tax=Pseudarthrobacter niigatensis TaxID=369935 RepID=A0AAJ1WGZ5_9MICC|nr:DUF262 domain-containing protein [Pseudarthrobacter niigatensis]MDQ0147325.1 hypothetical protein [Pseudarthrobacter niigatensis]MDQ0267142.1 hypothetical protein [Pseudarthrobacter niigatensis]
MSIATALRQIQERKLILPAIQREYVWKPSQIIRVFDSIMRGYPVGSFLSWRVRPETVSKFKFYGFMKDYSAFDNRHNPVVDIPTDREVVAVLDGQQRLTSLNIGLRGTYAYKVHGGWSNKPWSYPERRLYLNLLEEAPENEFGLKYHFQFLTKNDLGSAADAETKSWFPVSEIFDAAEPGAMMQIPARYGVGNNETAVALIAKLWQEIHHSASLHFYEEDVQDIERVLDIFVRVNSGGTVLSYSDLLLSIATAQWDGDARAAVHGLVDSLNQTGNGFNFSRDTILKSGLVLADVGDIGFKVKNFTTANMSKLEAGWDEMSASLHVAVGLLSDFGLSGGALTADSVLIPVAYYVHRRRLGHAYRESPASREDREALRSWVLRSLIVRGVWGSGLDTLLRDLREIIKSQGGSGFPAAAIEQAMATRGKSLAVTDALVDDILRLEYGKARTFAVLAALFPHVDTRNQFHVDHVFPAARLEKKVLAGQKTADGTPRFTAEAIDELVSLRDRLPNLQLLPGLENIGKSDKAPDDWLAAEFPASDNRSAFLARHALPSPLPHSVDEFAPFFEQRRGNLTARILDMFRAGSPELDLAQTSPPPADLDEELAEGDYED